MCVIGSMSIPQNIPWHAGVTLKGAGGRWGAQYISRIVCWEPNYIACKFGSVPYLKHSLQERYCQTA